MADESRAERVPIGWVLWHGAGRAGQSVQGFALGFLFLYYNQVVGLSGALTGLALAVASVVDAISDPTVGSWSDGFKSRFGRRHPFMFASILPVAGLFVLLFMPPDGLSQMGLFLWFTVTFSLMRTALTLFNLPYLALGAEVTQDYLDRTRIAAWRSMIGQGSALVVAAIAWNFVFRSTPENPTPQLDAEPYLPFAIVSALVMAALMGLSSWKTMDAIPHLPTMGASGRRFHVKHIYRDLFDALHSVSFRSLFLGHLVCNIYWGTTGALALHLKTFFWQLESVAIQWWQYAGIVGGMVGVPFTMFFNRIFDKKWTVILGVVVCVLGATGPVIASLFGLMPTSYAVLAVLLVGFAFLSSYAIEPVGVTVASMMGDMADEHELRKGTRQEGVYFAAFSFADKCTGAVGPLLAGVAIDIVGLDPGSKQGEVPASVLFDFGLVYAVIAVFVMGAIWVFWPYNLNRRRHTEIVERLRERRASEAEPKSEEAEEAAAAVRASGPSS
ncbi:MAG: MFS transporter [Gammaproteobacteria bacterium]|nr:MFS transporter [Gammaproteobacteria bacterium]